MNRPSSRSVLVLFLAAAAGTTHALDVAGVVANMPEFAQAFSCDASRTLLSETQRANIW